MEKSRLLCTFLSERMLYRKLKEIENKCDLVNNKIYVLQNVDKPRELLLTYNVYEFDNRISNTVLVHRKKETNTIYSLNAMNRIIQDINGGIFDENIRVPWEEYTNQLLILNGMEKNLKKINTQLFTVIQL